MEIDVNINNKQKHWVIVILEKCKNLLVGIFRFIVNFIKRIWRFLKKSWKYFLGILIVLIIIICVIAGYLYIQEVYIPEKKLNAAIAEIISNIESKNDSIKLEYAIKVLSKNQSWGFKDDDSYAISERLSGYRYGALKLIESKAYEGDVNCQYLLGIIYFLGEVSFFHPKDYAKSVYWYNEAALQGYSEAYYCVGIAYMEGLGVEVDMRKAVEFFKKGAEAGDYSAQIYYGDLFVEGVIIQVGSRKKLKPGYNPLYYDQYDLYAWEDVPEYEILIPKDIEQAKYWWKKAGNEDRLQKIYQ